MGNKVQGANNITASLGKNGNAGESPHATAAANEAILQLFDPSRAPLESERPTLTREDRIAMNKIYDSLDMTTNRNGVAYHTAGSIASPLGTHPLQQMLRYNLLLFCFS